MADYNKIYHTLDPTAPLDEGAFNKSRESAFMNKITEIKIDITRKLEKTKKKATKFASIASTSGAISVLTGGSAAATSFMAIGIPVGASLGVVAGVASATSMISLGF